MFANKNLLLLFFLESNCELTTRYELFQGWCADAGYDQVPCNSTFAKIFRSREWKQKLIVRTDVEQATCKVCDDIMEARRQTHDKKARDALSKSLHDHWQDQQADRRIYQAMRDCSRVGGSVLSCIVDGMDQAKFKCPRSLTAFNHLKQTWRPQLHVTGCIIHGIADIYWVGDADLSKDANATVQYLNEAIDVAIQTYAARKQKYPRHFVIQLDNTCRENKNSLIFRWAASLVAKGIFESVSLHFLRKGHTHEDIDQRFKIIAALISRQKLLETPKDFMDCIEAEMTVPPSHGLKVRSMRPPFDYWQHYSSPEVFPYDTHGHTGPNAGHAFRLIKWDGSHLPAGPSVQCSNGDIVMLVKHYMKDPMASQPPVTIIPKSCISSVPAALPSQASPRNPLSAHDAKEFKKTAEKCVQAPWKLTKAHLYLNGWVDFLSDAAAFTPSLPPGLNPSTDWVFTRWPRIYNHDITHLEIDNSETPSPALDFLVPIKFNPVYTSSATIATRTRIPKNKKRHGNFGRDPGPKAKAKPAPEHHIVAEIPNGTDEDAEAKAKPAAKHRSRAAQSSWNAASDSDGGQAIQLFEHSVIFWYHLDTHFTR